MQYLEKELSQTQATVICHLILLLFAQPIIIFKETFCCHDGTLGSFLFLWFLIEYLWQGMWIVERTHSAACVSELGFSSKLGDAFWIGGTLIGKHYAFRVPNRDNRGASSPINFQEVDTTCHLCWPRVLWPSNEFDSRTLMIQMKQKTWSRTMFIASDIHAVAFSLKLRVENFATPP